MDEAFAIYNFTYLADALNDAMLQAIQKAYNPTRDGMNRANKNYHRRS